MEHGNKYMIKYSTGLSKIVERIGDYYEKKDYFDSLKKLVYFTMETIEYISDDYFVVPKDVINKYLVKAKFIWDTDGDAEKLKALEVLYTKELTEIKPLIEILNNETEKAAMNCVMRVLEKRYDPRDIVQYIYFSLVCHIKDFETLNIAENTIKVLLEKHFKV